MMRQPERRDAGGQCNREGRALSAAHVGRTSAVRGSRIGARHKFAWRRHVDGVTAACSLPRLVAAIHARDRDHLFITGGIDDESDAIARSRQDDDAVLDRCIDCGAQGAAPCAAKAHGDDIRAFATRIFDGGSYAAMIEYDDRRDRAQRNQSGGRGGPRHPAAGASSRRDACRSGPVARIAGVVHRVRRTRLAVDEVVRARQVDRACQFRVARDAGIGLEDDYSFALRLAAGQRPSRNGIDVLYRPERRSARLIETIVHPASRRETTDAFCLAVVLGEEIRSEFGFDGDGVGRICKRVAEFERRRLQFIDVRARRFDDEETRECVAARRTHLSVRFGKSRNATAQIEPPFDRSGDGRRIRRFGVFGDKTNRRRRDRRASSGLTGSDSLKNLVTHRHGRHQYWYSTERLDFKDELHILQAYATCEFRQCCFRKFVAHVSLQSWRIQIYDPPVARRNSWTE
ncbi:MAG: hypothetical protein U1E19_10820 [Rhodoblastus sp.]